MEFPLLQSLSQVDTAVTLLPIHLLWPPTASPEQDTAAGGEGAQEKPPRSAAGSAQSLGCALASLPDCQRDMEHFPGTEEPPARLPGSRVGLGAAGSAACTAPGISWNCLLSLEKALLGECSVLRRAVLPLPTLLPAVVAVSRGKLETGLTIFPLGSRNPAPAAPPELQKGWRKRENKRVFKPNLFLTTKFSVWRVLL